MEREPKRFIKNGIIFTFLAFLLSSVLYFSPSYGGPEVLGGKRPGSQRPSEVISNTNEDEESGGEDIEYEEAITDEETLPVKMGEVSSLSKKAAPLIKESGFDTFNAQYQNQWKASFSKKTGKVKTLYGFSSKRYEDGPESVAKGFLRDSNTIFGLRHDISDLKTQKVDKTSTRDHVRLQQNHNGIPILGAFVLVHSNKENQVTMVQNGYVQNLQVNNEELIAEELAKNIAQNDLQTSLGRDAILFNPKAEKVIVPRNKQYYYIWKITISTRKPWGFWVYHVDAANGQIFYKGNEILSLRNGKGRAYTSNSNYHLGRISNVTLKNMFTSSETADWGYLFGTHAMILDYNENDPRSLDYRFLYEEATDKDWFDATNAYYKLNTIRDWWDKNVIRKNALVPDNIPYFTNTYPIPTFVNVDSFCNAYYTPDFLEDESWYPGFVFGDEDSCASGSEDIVIDDDVVRHEYTHAMMDWLDFDVQFGGEVDSYGRAMGEGNADFFAFLNNPRDPLIGDVAWAWSTEGYLRNLDNTRMYPRDVDDPDVGVPEEHYTGEIWGGYLYDLYRILKKNALRYVFQAFYYFDSSGGHMASAPDFGDAIYAQYSADYDLTNGKPNLTVKAWGSWASRGLNGILRDPYSHLSDYFGTGSEGSDDSFGYSWVFPPTKALSTNGNFLNDGDEHEYLIEAAEDGMDLTATVTAKKGGLIDPTISLYGIDGYFWTSVLPLSATKAVLTWPNLQAGSYVIVVSGTATVPARSYYNFKITLK